MFKFVGRGLAVETIYRIPILHPATNQPMRATVEGKEYECYVEGYSTDSKKAVGAFDVTTDRRIKSRGKTLSSVELRAEKVDYLAELTTGWCLITLEGDVIDEPFSVAAARELYNLPEWRWLCDQVEREFGDRANFTRKPANS